MQVDKLAEKLVFAKNNLERTSLLKDFNEQADEKLAFALKEICYSAWTKEPTKAQNAALALENLANFNPNEKIIAISAWISGIACLTEGKIEDTVKNLETANQIFLSINEEHLAAQTQVSKLYALALLGRYEEAVQCGKNALEIFEKYKDELAAGKIEKNLGNIVSRQENHFEAEKYYLSAHARFSDLKDEMELTMCENGLAMTYTSLNNFRKAENFYFKALQKAKKVGMFVTEAEIEASIGNLLLFRAQFDQALKFLELSRQKYEKLEMPHQTAVAELEIADAYLELNLVDEAFELYEKTVGTLAGLKMQGEEARARVNYARAAIAIGKKELAKQELEKSAHLYQAEKNIVGEAFVKLIEIQFALLANENKKAFGLIKEANQMLLKSGNIRYSLLAKWLEGEVLLNLERFNEAREILTKTFEDALKQENPYLAQTIQTTLGRIALKKKNFKEAESHFKKAINFIETLREPLPAEDFKIAFLGDKLLPYQELAKIYLLQNNIKEAFLLVEQSRSRALAEKLSGQQISKESSDENTAKIYRQLADLREELNWYYNRINRATNKESKSLLNETKFREKKINELMRQIKNLKGETNIGGKVLNFKELQKSLGKTYALIEFVIFEDQISAFVITDKKLEYVENLVQENEISELLESLHFQFETMRYGSSNIGFFVNELKKRTDSYLQKLYEKLLRPLESLIGNRHLVFIPVGRLHYLPFHALHNGEKYLIEEREVLFSPSATVFQFCLEKESRPFKNALLVGFSDEKIPFAVKEVEELQKVFPENLSLIGKNAGFSNFKKNVGQFDLVHLACHGQFRSDNPMFSSLHLADGLLTVRDISELNLNAELVVLSACETGINKILPGEELLGLTRGFLSAGVSSLVLTLWTVDDKTARDLMVDFYSQLQAGKKTSTALRIAQGNLIRQNVHPYYWSPFFLVGK